MPTVIDLDGVLLPAAEARLPVLDRGVLLGDSVYEVLRTYGTRPFELHAPPLRAYREGVKVLLVEADRGRVDPAAKTGSRLTHVLALRAARATGAHEALFVDGGGRVTEGTSSNLFAVIGGRLVTPPLAVGILEGVTRGVVLRLARQEGLAVEEAPLLVGDVERAGELFITSTGREILPASRLGDAAVGAGRPGPVTTALHAAFRRLADAAARE